MPEDPSCILPVDRISAAVRAVWRLLASTILAGAALAVWTPIRWNLLWHEQRASFLALTLIIVILVGFALATLVGAVRWSALAVWPGSPCVECSTQKVSLMLGPFGNRSDSWHDIEVSREWLVEDDPSSECTVRLVSRSDGADLTAMIQRFAAIDAESLSTRLAPLLDALEPNHNAPESDRTAAASDP